MTQLLVVVNDKVFEKAFCRSADSFFESSLQIPSEFAKGIYETTKAQRLVCLIGGLGTEDD